MPKINKLLKLSEHEHTGRIRNHEHTSYVPLAFLLVVVGYVLMVFTTTSLAATPYNGPEAGSVGVSGIMPGKPPTTAAVIQSPGSGQHFTTSPVTISGTCPKNTLVELYKNDIFAGSTFCSDNEKFSADIDLLIGQNTIVARVYDALNQQGPDSNSVVIYYDALPPQGSAVTSFNFGGNQLLLNTDAVFRGIFPGKSMTMPVTVLGGTPAYAVQVQWGDGEKPTVAPRNDNMTFNVEHSYKKAGTFQIVIEATDTEGRVAFLTVAAVVNGQPDVVAATSSKLTTSNQLLVLWPLYTGSLVMVSSFWLGEQREKQVLRKRHQLLTA